MMKFILILLILCLTSCNGRIKDLKQFVEDQRKQLNTSSGTKPPAFSLPSPLIYSAKVTRMPFDNLMTLDNSTGSIDHPLQGFPLSTIRFIGTIQQDNQTWAVLKAPDNIIYQVKIGDVIGKQNGRIVKICSDRLDVRENTTDELGLLNQRITTIQLKSGT